MPLGGAEKPTFYAEATLSTPFSHTQCISATKFSAYYQDGGSSRLPSFSSFAM